MTPNATPVSTNYSIFQVNQSTLVCLEYLTDDPTQSSITKVDDSEVDAEILMVTSQAEEPKQFDDDNDIAN